MKNARHEKILAIIEQQSVDKQEELLRLLHEAGFKVTQATVSRDIRALNLVKTATGSGGYRYVAQLNRDKPAHTPDRFETIFRESVIKIDYAGNIVMVNCFSGMANAACELFDSQIWDNVVGTLSGDDTFIVLMRTEQDAANLSVLLKQYMKSPE